MPAINLKTYRYMIFECPRWGPFLIQIHEYQRCDLLILPTHVRVASQTQAGKAHASALPDVFLLYLFIVVYNYWLLSLTLPHLLWCERVRSWVSISPWRDRWIGCILWGSEISPWAMVICTSWHWNILRYIYIYIYEYECRCSAPNDNS